MENELQVEQAVDVQEESLATPKQGNELVENTKKKVITKLLPTSDLDLYVVAKSACAKWKETPEIKLIWKDVEEFEAEVDNFALSLESKKNTGASRTPLSKKISMLNKTIDHLLIHIKDSLKDKYGKESYQAYFPEFGIVYNTNSFRLPRDTQERKQALNMLVSALTRHQLDGRNSQLSVWQALKDEFEQYVSETSQNVSNSSKFTGDKKMIRPAIKKSLDSLALLIRANYPENYDSVLRMWGFLKENY